MSKLSSPPGWPTWLLLLIAVGPPSAVVVPLLPTITHNPLLAGTVLVCYWLLLGFTAFLKRIWDRRGDTWADASANSLERMLRLLLARTGHRYQAFFCYEHRDLDMKGISTRGTYTLDLEQVFVEVRIDPTPAHKVSPDPLRLPSELRSGSHDIWDYLTLLGQHLVILGAPGSGKTTLLKHLGLCLVQNRHQRRARAKQLPWTIPLFLTLREHSSASSEQSDYSLVEAVVTHIQRWKQHISSEWVERQLQKGRCLVLLDGLDEIADPTQRQHMVNWVQNQMLAYGTNRFVITSRPLGYRTNPLERVAVLDVQPFSFEQVTRFLYSWYHANEIKRAMRDEPGEQMRAIAGAEDLLKRLHATPALFALAVNPLLLTMIATVHLYYGKLPGARITLYKAICEVFLSRRADLPNSPQELRAEQRQLVLQSLAYIFMQQGKREMTHEEICPLLLAPLKLVSQTLTPQDFLDHLEAISSGLLLEREQGIYSFAHQTFQEYLAMIYIQEKHLEHELVAKVESSWWYETILLFCAQADATAILEACLKQPSPSLEALTLAINCVEEARTVQAETKERLYMLLERGINNTDPEQRRVIAEALLRRRLQQMRPLQEGAFIDTSFITCAEYQLFVEDQRVHGIQVAPDTWNEGTFQEGHGRDSLLGVRFQDAQAFCRWLTERDQEGWSYRLPMPHEYQQIKSTVGGKLPEDTSYWEANSSWENPGSIVWLHGGPSRPLREQVLRLLFDSFGDFPRSFTSDLPHLNIAHDITRDYALNIARNIANNLASHRPIAIGSPVSDFVLAYDCALNCATTLDDNFGGEVDVADALDDAGNFIRGLISFLDSDADGIRLDLADAIELYLILFLFIHRPKGMLPVYEGILLTKVRTETSFAPQN